MLEVIPAGEQHYRLVDGEGRDVGWIRRRVARDDVEDSVVTVAHAIATALDGPTPFPVKQVVT